MRGSVISHWGPALILFVLGYVLDPVPPMLDAWTEWGLWIGAPSPRQTVSTSFRQLARAGAAVGHRPHALNDESLLSIPQFLIVGVPKSGTSALYHGLCGEY